MNALANAPHKRVIACVVDTECAYKNPNAHGMVYHFGAVFGDLNQDYSFHTVNMDYYVLEVMEDMQNFLFKNKEGTAYATNQSMARAWKDAINNPHKVKRWKDIISEFNDKLKAMGCDYITSYNFNFDIGVGDKVGTIRRTHQQLTDKTFYLPRGVEHFCLMDIVANKMANRDFSTWIKTLNENELNQMTTEKGNLSYSAECMLRYLSKDLYYTEQHTALRDALMEFRLAMHTWKHYQNDIKKHFVNNVKAVSWQQFNSGLSSTAKMKLRNEPKGKKATPKKTAKTKGFKPKQGELF